MKTLNKFLIAGLVVSSLIGCKDRMIELNTNPDTVGTTTLPFMFTGATMNYGYTGRGQLTSVYSGMASIQQVTDYDAYDSESTGPFNDPNTQTYSSFAPAGYTYDQYFSNFGNKLQTILNEISYMDEAEQLKFNDIKAITMILMSHEQWRIAEQYGAMIYSEAFKAITEGINFPAYELGADIYKEIDATLKEAVELLSLDPVDGATELGAADFFYGYTFTANKGGGSTVAALGNNATQRARWKKLANIYRLEMAWKLQATDPSHFSTVSAEVVAVPDGLMTSAEDGFYYHYPQNYDSNPDDVDIISRRYAVSQSFLNSLMKQNDPRVPLFARPNGLSSLVSKNFRLMRQYFQDTLDKYQVLRDSNIFVGMSVNPKYRDLRLPEIGAASQGDATQGLVGQQVMTFELPNPVWPATEIPMANFNGEVETYEALEETITLGLMLTSPAQGRYFVKAGGKQGVNLTYNVDEDVTSLLYDGVGGQFEGLQLRREIFSYARQCFMLAYLGINAGGKTAEEWYRAGIESALVQQQQDAIAFKILFATDASYPQFPGVNEGGVYSYDEATIAAYVAAQPFTQEAIMNQAWFASYQNPEFIYQWNKVTGLPKMLDVNTPAEEPATPYWEQPYKNSSEVQTLVLPRRSQLPDKTTTNPKSYAAIKQILENLAGYGGTMENTNGRVWWDVNN